MNEKNATGGTEGTQNEQVDLVVTIPVPRVGECLTAESYLESLAAVRRTLAGYDRWVFGIACDTWFLNSLGELRKEKKVQHAGVLVDWRLNDRIEVYFDVMEWARRVQEQMEYEVPKGPGKPASKAAPRCEHCRYCDRTENACHYFLTTAMSRGVRVSAASCYSARNGFCGAEGLYFEPHPKFVLQGGQKQG